MASTQDQTMDFAAGLLSRIFSEDISASEIQRNQKVFIVIFDRLVESARSNEPETLEYNRKKITFSLGVSPGMSDSVESRLRDARARLGRFD